MAVVWEFSESKHPPRPPKGQVGVYTGPARHGSTARLLYKSRGIHITVSEARGRFTLTCRWQWDGHAWTETQMGIDTREQAFDLARTRIELLRSIVGAFGEGRQTELVEALRDQHLQTLKDLRTAIDKALRHL